MLCRKFKNIIITKPSNSNVICHPLVHTRSFSKWFDLFSGTNMSSARMKAFREIFLTRVLNAWTRTYKVNSVFKKCVTERGINRMFLYFRQVFFRPRTQLLVSATATYHNTEEKPGPPKKCRRNIKDKEMKKLIKDLDRVEDLSKATLFCEGCDKRIVIDTKHKGVQYCECPDSHAPTGNYDGWVPYMESEDVIIWRKEYKPGGLYAYKVYGRYKHIKAEDFALIQVDSAYRKVWDTAVASITVVEREANGISDQTVLHWEVLWPKLFTNRDYVYLRRHKEFNVRTRCLVHKDGIFPDTERCKPDPEGYKKRQSNVHSHAKEKSLEMDRKEEKEREAANQTSHMRDNKVYVIVSRSCTHPNVPETKNAVRVMEYWSHMVVTTLNGPDRPGMEFVLTYYDEPAVGGLPSAVTAWAMGRAGPAFLLRMREAAQQYAAWRAQHKQQSSDFSPFQVSKVSFDQEGDGDGLTEDMESPPDGPEDESSRSDGSTQTKPVLVTPIDDEPKDGPRAEVEVSAPLKYASKDPQTQDLPSVLPRCEDPSDDVVDVVEDLNSYQLTMTTKPQEYHEEKQAIEADDKTHLHITVKLPMSAINKLTEGNDKENKMTKQNDYRENKETEQNEYKDNKNTDMTHNNETAVSTNPPENISMLESDEDSISAEEDSDSDSIAVAEEKPSFWRYLYPLYYFV